MRAWDWWVRPFPKQAERPLVWAHRGASGEAPENTLEAFALAEQQGADGVELDVMVCGSGEVVVCHDVSLQRLAGSPARVWDTSLAELQTLDVAHHLPTWGKPARIPTLEDVLLHYPGWVNIELKEDRWTDDGLAWKVARLVRRLGAEDRVVISAFHPMELLRMRLDAPRLPLAYLVGSDQKPALRAGLPGALVGAQAIHPEHWLCTPASVAAWHAAGLAVAAWTVDDPVRAVQLADLGVDAVITNFPSRLKEALSRTRRIR